MRKRFNWCNAEISNMYNATSFFINLAVAGGGFSEDSPIHVRLAGVSPFSMRNERGRAERATCASHDMMDGREDMRIESSPLGKDSDEELVDVYIKVEEHELWHEAVSKFDDEGEVLPWLHLNQWLVDEGYALKKD